MSTPPSIREMKAAMTAAGVSFADCTEKSELVARYKTAMANFSSRASARAPPKATASAPPPKASRVPPAPPKQLSVEEMGREKDGSDGGETGAEIRRVCSCKDFYEILRVERSCKEEDLKKAYRKLAIRLHPDKCHLTGAEDAFKKVSTAFSCLNDAKTRSGYDIHGEEVCKPGNAGFRGSGFRGDVDAEELFRAFCGSGSGGEKFENIKAAVQKNPWVLLVALTMLANVIHVLEIFIVYPFLLLVPIGCWMLCPPHVRRQFKTALTAMLMRA